MEMMTLVEFFDMIEDEVREDGINLYLETDYYEIAFGYKTTFTADYPGEKPARTVIRLDLAGNIVTFSCSCKRRLEICPHMVAFAMAVKNDEVL